MEFLLLKELVVVFGLSIIVLIACHRLRVPPVVGLLITGVLAGPHGFGLVQSRHEIELLAELGVVLLLFTIGTEFSLSGLLEIRRLVLLGGAIQVGLTLAVTAIVATAFGVATGTAILLGCLCSLSSTALVLKTLQGRAELDSLYGRTTFAILIFQDLVIVPMMLFVPQLAPGEAAVAAPSLWMIALKAVGIVTVVLFGATRIVPIILNQVARTQNRELFLLTVMVICFSVAFLTQEAGLSLALGALLAGLIISESEYSHQALSTILPFQQIFTTVFFVSVGMLLDINFAMHNLPIIIGGTIGVVVLKALLAIPAALALGFSLRTGVLTGLAVAQIGEFSFVLANAGLGHGVIAPEMYQIVLTISVLTIALTPFMISRASAIAVILLRRRTLPGATPEPAADEKHLMGHDELSKHLIIVGFGLNGRFVAKAAEAAKMEYIAIELNPDRVRAARAEGRPVIYGDASEEAVLIEEGVKGARFLVVVIPDAVAARRVVALGRRLNPELYIIVRTRLIGEIEELRKLGADEVLSEEFEVAVEIFGRLLAKQFIPQAEIEQLIHSVRQDGYAMIRKPSDKPLKLSDLRLHVPNIDLTPLRVAETSPLIGVSLHDAHLRRRFGITVLAIKRGNEVLANPSGDTPLQAHDIVIAIGSSEHGKELEAVFSG